MTGIRTLVSLIVLAVLVVGGHDGYEVIKTTRDIRNTASAAASDAAGKLTASHGADVVGARKAADDAAKRAGDVITTYSYDPVAHKVTLTVGGTASSWVAGRIERSWTDNITATASATASAA